MVNNHSCQWSLSASGDLGNPEELRATRKPLPLLRYDGSLPSRNADRQSAASLNQLPPQSARDEPLLGPLGSPTAPLGVVTVPVAATFPDITVRVL
jgi:hypothetical protein